MAVDLDQAEIINEKACFWFYELLQMYKTLSANIEKQREAGVDPARLKANEDMANKIQQGYLCLSRQTEQLYLLIQENIDQRHEITRLKLHIEVLKKDK